MKGKFNVSGGMSALLYIDHFSIILVGTRVGDLNVFQVTNDSSEFKIHSDQLKFLLTRTNLVLVIKFHSKLNVHNKKGVTDIVFKDGEIYSSGKDGYYCKLKISDLGAWSILSRNRLTRKMDCIQKLNFCGDHLIALGFYKKNFIVFNQTRQCEVRPR